MKYWITKSPKLWKDSAAFAFILLAGIETIISVAAISLSCIPSFWVRLLLVVILYLVLTLGTLVFKTIRAKESITISIRGIPVTVKLGDLFMAVGWKLISFTENFDTEVDDITINRNSVNGIFIEKYVGKENLATLQEAIMIDDEDRTLYPKEMKEGHWVYPLGRIKIFRDYMLMAFTKMNKQKEVHTTRSDYERCLRVMWVEISRTYANKPISLPLLGSGVLRFDDWPEKSLMELLKCMLCTLRTSGVHIAKPITIILTKEALEKINLYELKGVQ